MDKVYLRFHKKIWPTLPLSLRNGGDSQEYLVLRTTYLADDLQGQRL